jgi:hypothetical protein
MRDRRGGRRRRQRGGGAARLWVPTWAIITRGAECGRGNCTGNLPVLLDARRVWMHAAETPRITFEMLSLRLRCCASTVAIPVGTLLDETLGADVDGHFNPKIIINPNSETLNRRVAKSPASTTPLPHAQTRADEYGLGGAIRRVSIEVLGPRR